MGPGLGSHVFPRIDIESFFVKNGCPAAVGFVSKQAHNLFAGFRKWVTDSKSVVIRIKAKIVPIGVQGCSSIIDEGLFTI